jgi:Fic family protein
MTNRENRILSSIKSLGEAKIYEIVSAAGGASLATVKRDLVKLAKDGMVAVHGRGKATRYALTAAYRLLETIDIDSYFEKEIDERNVLENFNWALIRDMLPQASLFTPAEKERLKALQQVFAKRISDLSETAYHKELERLAIDLSWKSSQIEGNTYSLLEAERLLKEKQTAGQRISDKGSARANVYTCKRQLRRVRESADCIAADFIHSAVYGWKQAHSADCRQRRADGRRLPADVVPHGGLGGLQEGHAHLL